MYDVTICTNETEEIIEQESNSFVAENEDNSENDSEDNNESNNESNNEDNSEKISVTMYAYDGNQFRTVYELTEDEILSDLEKYLDYDSSTEPTIDELSHDNEIIDKYTLELINGGVIA